MHVYHFDKLLLTEKLAEFEGGQLFMIAGVNKSHLKLLMSVEAQASYEQILKHVRTEKTGDRISYWGGIKGWEMPKTERKLLVHLDWLCVQNTASKWEPIQQPTPCAITMDIHFTGYYFPKGGERIKVWTTLLMATSRGEFFRFYKKGDADRLVLSGEEYAPAKLAKPELVPTN